MIGHLIKFGTFATISLILVVLLHNTMINRVSSDTVEYTAVFTDVSGLRVGDDVRAAGVKVGRVDGIDLHENEQALVRFTVAVEQEMTDTTRLTMRYQNLLGQRYLALGPGETPGTALEPGHRISTDQTSPGFDLTALMNGFEPLFAVLEPDEVNQLAESVVAVLQGEAGTIENLLNNTTDLAASFTADEEVFVALLDSLTPVMQDLAARGDDFDATVEALNDMMTTLADEREVFGESLESVSALSERIADLTAELRPLVADDLVALQTAAAMFADADEQLGLMLESLPMATGAFARPMAHGNWLNIYICSLTLDLSDVGLELALPPVERFSEVCRTS